MLYSLADGLSLTPQPHQPANCNGPQIDRLEFMHSRGILHRDIQLGNTVVGLPPNDQTLYMIDFGFSKQYIDRTTGRHIEPERRKRDFIGNYWFRFGRQWRFVGEVFIIPSVPLTFIATAKVRMCIWHARDRP